MVRHAGTTRTNAYADDLDFATSETLEDLLRTAERGDRGGGEPRGVRGAEDLGCYVKALPSRLTGKAAKLAAHLNPANRTPFEAVNLPPGVMSPMALTLLVSKYWGPEPEELSVSFVEDIPSNLRERIVEHMNAWSERIGKSFAETNGVGLVRITLEDDGFWSFLGTDVALIPESQPTMSLEGFSMRTPEREYKRVVRHETGHTLGFPHEHMRKELVARIDRQKAFAFFLETQGWDSRTVEQQVLTPLGHASVVGTPADEDSIMCYQLPGSITKDGRPIAGGLDINETDFAFAEVLYPQASPVDSRSRKGHKAGKSSAKKRARGENLGIAPDWGEENDVDLTGYGLA
jgi:Astacin (Peptidase family M12A)